jgi:hypothetical protein
MTAAPATTMAAAETTTAEAAAATAAAPAPAGAAAADVRRASVFAPSCRPPFFLFFFLILFCSFLFIYLVLVSLILQVLQILYTIDVLTVTKRKFGSPTVLIFEGSFPLSSRQIVLEGIRHSTIVHG